MDMPSFQYTRSRSSVPITARCSFLLILLPQKVKERIGKAEHDNRAVITSVSGHDDGFALRHGEQIHTQITKLVEDVNHSQKDSTSEPGAYRKLMHSAGGHKNRKDKKQKQKAAPGDNLLPESFCNPGDGTVCHLLLHVGEIGGKRHTVGR